MVEALKGYALSCGTKDVSQITGHSMRVTGAQNLLTAGLDLEQIKLVGRWKSTAQMMKYLREMAINEAILSKVLTEAKASSVTEQQKSEGKAKRAKTRWSRFKST